MCARCEGRAFSESRRLQEAQDGATQTCSAPPRQSRGCAASTMERPPILTAPIIASDTWFAEGSAVIDAKVTEKISAKCHLDVEILLDGVVRHLRVF